MTESRHPRVVPITAPNDKILAGFLTESGLDLEDLYTGDRCWSDHLAAADQPVLEAGPSETSLRRAIGRLLHVDDGERLTRYRDLLSGERPMAADLGVRDRRLLQMLVDAGVRADTT